MLADPFPPGYQAPEIVGGHYYLLLKTAITQQHIDT